MKFFINVFYILTNILISLCATSQFAIAQSVQTDGTTPTQPENCSGNCTIEGGLKQGDNLFHSFERFNVDANATVLFQDSGVSNIFSRVTGNSISEILGTLGVTGGDANLFLLNPNGIIFGQGSSLNVNGSFLATTTNAIRFSEQGFFDATPNEIPLLNINPSALSFAQGNQGNIVNQSIAPAGEDPSGLPVFGLRVPNNKSLLLVGGDVILDGGRINAFGGRIELGGLAEVGEIKINFSNTNNKNISLNFFDRFQKANVFLHNIAVLNVAFEDKGDIAIDANNIDISGQSFLLAGIGVSFGTIDSQSGTITLNASQKLKISDNSIIANEIGLEAKGSGGNIDIKAGSLFINNGSVIQSATFGIADAGDITIRVPNGLVEISESSKINTVIQSLTIDDIKYSAIGKGGNIQVFAQKMLLEDRSFIDASTLGQGDAGNVDIFVKESLVLNSNSRIFSVINPEAIGNGGSINIEANQISLNNGSQLVANVGGQGEGGDIILNVFDSVNITGIGTEEKLSENITTRLSSGLVTATEKGGDGQAGNIKVDTNSFHVADGAIVSSQTVNDSNGGEIIINANTFEAINGGQIIASADGVGDSGDIKIEVADNILLLGKDPQFADRLAEFDNNIEDFQKNVGNEAPGNSGFFASSRQDASGEGGNIEVAIRELNIQQGAEIKVSATGTGEAGTLTIDALDVTLDRGELTATTRRGDRGNITLTNADSLLLRNQSQIKTDAEESATGGNITLFADAIALLDNSNITATAFKGSGGKISLTTQGIFQETGSEINASSQLGIDGEIAINSPDVDPTSEVFQLADVPIDAEAILAQNLCKLEGDKIASGSSFIVTGRGGLTPTSAESLSNADNVVRWANRDDLEISDNGLVGVRQREKSDVTAANYPVMQQSQGWVTTVDGSVWLVANSPKTIPQHTQAVHPNCGTLSE